MKKVMKGIIGIIASILLAFSTTPKILKANASLRYNELDELFQTTLNGILEYEKAKDTVISAEKELLYDIELKELGVLYSFEIDKNLGFAILIDDGEPQITEISLNDNPPYKETSEQKVYVMTGIYWIYNGKSFFDSGTGLPISDETLNMFSESAYRGGSDLQYANEQVNYIYRSETPYNILYSIPTYTYGEKNGCVPVAGVNLIAYLDKIYPNLIPDYEPGRTILGKYRFNTENETIIELSKTLHAEMGTNVNGNGTTVTQFRNGMKSYVNKRGYSISYTSLVYTPYRLPKNATEFEQAAHREARSFYDLTGEKNALKYIATESKRTGKKTALEYFEKTTGVFDDKGMLAQREIEAVKQQAKRNTGNIWHGFISLGEEDSPKINTVEKCIALVKGTFGGFFKDMHMNGKNLDLVCALHTDKPHHYHIHFLFFEKEPKYKDSEGRLHYRSKGRIEKQVIDRMKVRLGMYLSSGRTEIYSSRNDALRALRGGTEIKKVMASPEEIQKELLLLAKALPTTGRLSYGSKDMEPYRGRVDRIVRMLLSYKNKDGDFDGAFNRSEKRRDVRIGSIGY